MKRPTTSYQAPSKRGSALLIVLGMFAFMLVSAVAFSVYMRASRAPSSYLLRNATLRQVVKAAVARAIDEVDTAIGNDPFPGVGYNHDYGGSGSMGMGTPDYKNDTWRGRVFTPGGETNMAATVSTLTLEALGYLPPSLINDVRYWSRHTRTATWHAFNYGLGRYAFTAVNVSDFFDVNNFITPENGNPHQYLNRSSAPHGRISPTYLFRHKDDERAPMDSGGPDAAAFLKALADGSGLGNNPPIEDVPFVSMMDYNLALGDNALGGWASPFNNLIMNNNNSTLYSGTDQVAKRQVLMAGGWNGDANLSYSEYDMESKASDPDGRVNLRYPEFQPFAGCSWFPNATTLDDCYNNVSVSHPFWHPYNNNLPIIATAMLCDYLDYDSVPLSLCIPCTEPVPMICGVELNDGAVVCETEYVQGPVVTTPSTTPGGAAVQTRTDTCNLKITVDFNPTITVVYPFRYERPGIPDYEVECYARIFFEEEQAGPDSNLNDGGLRNAFFGLGTLDQNWSTLNTGASGASFIEMKCSDVLKIPGSIFNDFANNSGVNREQKATIQLPLRVEIPTVTKGLATLNLENAGTGWTIVPGSGTDLNQIDFYPIGTPGAGRINLGPALENTAAGPIYRPMVAMWVRIKDRSNNRTVDMAPAIPAYDTSIDSSLSVNQGLNNFNFATAGNNSPVPPAFRFYPQKSTPGIAPDGRSGGPYNGVTAVPAPVTDNATWKQKAYITNDPRINWAPEHWWVDGTGGNPADLWLTGVQGFRSGRDWCDLDIFMGASNQGYLQSMYEWMMIPQVRELNVNNNAEWGVFEDGVGYDGVIRTAIGDVAHANVMWRTYRSDVFDPNNTWGSIDNLPFDDADNGLRVNPYTDNTNVMFGAFANMPQDWWAASSNHLAQGKGYMNPASTSLDKTYLFEWSKAYDDVYSMAQFWMTAFRGTDVNDLYKSTGLPDRWEERVDGFLGGLLQTVKDYHNRDRWVFDGGTRFLNWVTGETMLPTSDNVGPEVQDILQNDLTFVDRKFLYGYLKGCFANTSQLFLVFVRAETTSGGAAGAGARAVALVWRDPAAPSNGGLPQTGVGKDNAQQYLRPYNSGAPDESWRFRPREYPPHKTRILFYHQFD